MSIHSDFLLPFFTNCICGSQKMAEQRAKIVPHAKGVVVEIGFGSGHNLKFYNSESVKKVIAVEPSLSMQKYASERIQESALNVEMLTHSAEQIPLPDNSVDTVLSTYTLCTIPNIQRALSEIRRILKPTGQFLFCEHGIAPDPSIQKWQTRIEPFWKKVAGGCHLTRNIPELIICAGFRMSTIEAGMLPNAPAIAGYNYWGSASAH